MRKTERLDQILIRLGYATHAQIDEAVARQKEGGGRIGMNLVDIGAVTEEELFDALVEQFRVPTVQVDESTVLTELMDRMPEGALLESLIVPVAWNEQQRVLSLAVANPSDEEAIESVRLAFDAKKVRVSMAPESVLADLVMRLREGGMTESGSVRLVALPELFEPETEGAPNAETVSPGADDAPRVVMVSGGAGRKNFLPPVFKAEGRELIVVSGPEETRAALALPDIAAVLVAHEIREAFDEWVRRGDVPPPAVEVTPFSSVSESLLENPLPYVPMAKSLRASVQALAEFRCAAEGASPPYALMAADVQALAERLALTRVVADGLHLGLHLLVPTEEGTSIDPFKGFAGSVELARRIRFPWPVDTMLGHCLGLYLGRLDLATVNDPKDEVLVAAQVLSIVWFRHNHARTEGDDPIAELRSSLRELAGRFATLDVVETYVETLKEADADVEARRVLLVGGDRIGRSLSPALARMGVEVLSSPDVASAQAVVGDEDPSAIVLDHAELGAEVEKVSRVLKLDGNALVFVLTDENDPALVLNLLDTGVDDVYAPPHDFDVVSARIHRSIRSRSPADTTGGAPSGQFAATFEAFSFLDLAQMLANGMKTVRVDLKNGNGEEAVLFIAKGRPVHASCGALTGAQAVYNVISWEDDGEFVVREADDFPEANIAESIEALLMEGVRLLDESRA